MEREEVVQLARQVWSERRRAARRWRLLRSSALGVPLLAALLAPRLVQALQRPHLPAGGQPVQDAVLTVSATPAHAPTGLAILRVFLADRTGAPLAGRVITLAERGPVPLRALTRTNTAGIADFAYRAAGDGASLTVTALDGSTLLAQRALLVRGTPPAVRTSTVLARFYRSDGRCTFDTPASTLPVLVRSFAGINFVGRPLYWYPGDPGQSALLVAGAGATVGLASLYQFNAALTGTLLVARAGAISFTVLVDDAFNLGVGGGASRVRGTLSDPPLGGLTAVGRLPVLGAFNQGHLAAVTRVTVRFPRAGRYPYEIDWAECEGGGEALRLSSDGQDLALAP
jgi:hypothetical protein